MSDLEQSANVIAGRDPQLERAVQEALTLMKTQGVELKPEPPAPIRYKRPEKKNQKGTRIVFQKGSPKRTAFLLR